MRSRAELSHLERATLAREYLLAGHLIDRASMPHLIAAYGRETMQAIAIDEWMGASPVYTARMQRALGFEGSDVATMFKGMQLDIGAPPEFLDFRFRVIDDHTGDFWLDHCGALMDVEPMGEDFVVGMCHTIEDPTFAATACASNPRARMEPVHRPPRHPADRHPHCHWRITIDPAAEPLVMPERAARVARTPAGRWPVAAAGPPTGDTRGRADYGGPLDPDLRMEDFTPETLGVIADEAAIQGHLLVAAFLDATRDHGNHDDAVDFLGRQFTGVAGVVAERLVRAFHLPPGLDGLASLFALHPAFGAPRLGGLDRRAGGRHRAALAG